MPPAPLLWISRIVVPPELSRWGQSEPDLAETELISPVRPPFRLSPSDNDSTSARRLGLCRHQLNRTEVADREQNEPTDSGAGEW